MLSPFRILLLLAVWSSERCEASWIHQSVSGGGHIASLSFDALHGQVMVTGTAFQDDFWNMTTGVQSFAGDDNGVSCFVATLDVTEKENHGRLIFSEPNVCTVVVALPHNGFGKGTAIGYDQMKGGGLQGDGLQPALAGIDVFGMMLTQGLTSVVQDEKRVSYPMAAVSDTNFGLFMAVQETTLMPPIISLEDDPLASILQLQQEVERGSVDWVPAIQKVHTKTGEVVWTTPIETEDGHSVVTSVAYMPSRNVVLVAGSSNGKGFAVGAGYTSQDWDGFLTKVDPETGEIDEVEGVKANHSVRIQTQPKMDDYINAICVLDDKVYVVGTTDGTMEGFGVGGAFMIKYDIDTLQAIWKRQIPGKVHGKVCGVSEDDDVVYIGGNVAGGLSIEVGAMIAGSGLQDVFVSQLSATDGTISWTRQFGSHRDDTLESMVVDTEGNAIVGGNSLEHAYVPSSLFSPTNDIFMLSLDKLDGAHQDLVHAVIVPPKTDDKKKPNLVIVFAVVIPVVLALIVTACECRRRFNSKIEVDTAAPDAGGAGDIVDDLDLPTIATSQAQVV
jgi:hypothetical protein